MESEVCRTGHAAVVVGICKGTYLVEITPSLKDCGGCAISAVCSSGREQKITVGAVLAKGVGRPSEGQKVRVNPTMGSQSLAVLLLLVLPLVMMLIVATALYLIADDDLVAGIGGIAAACLLYFFINRIWRNKSPHWTIIQIEEK